MPLPEDDTIAAIVTPPGTGGIAVIRVSGARAISVVDEIFRGTAKLSSSAPNMVHFGRIVDETGGEVDEVLVTVFHAPHSYTAEDVAEVSCHGSTYIARRILELMVNGGARPANPGEFTKRAFLNGRIDLSQAEAVADLVSADTRASHDLAIAQLRGKLSGKIGLLRQRILDLCSTLELELDFSEEGLEFVKRDELREELSKLHHEVAQILDSFELGKIYKEGIRVVLAGVPNVGKSSVLNALMREERAIVTSVSGTTRDTIEESISIGGMKFTIIDTAGLRTSDDVVEIEGIRRSRDQIQYADLILFVIDPTRDLDQQKSAAIESIGGITGWSEKIILVINKADLVDNETLEDVFRRFQGDEYIVTSAVNGIGIAELERGILNRFQQVRKGPIGETIILSNLRQRESLQKVVESISTVEGGIDAGVSPEFLAMDLRVALTHLSHIIGIDIADEVLNNIFSKFCIGK